jgi:hypothetical protein
MWHETENLSLDDDGTLYHGSRRLGPIEDAAEAAFDLGLSDEYDELLDLWQDAAFDYRGQVLADYRSQQGF